MTPSGQAPKHAEPPKLSWRTLRTVERELNVYLVHPQDGLRVNPSTLERYGIINGVEGEEEFYIGEVSSTGRWFSKEELVAKIQERLPKKRR